MLHLLSFKKVEGPALGHAPPPLPNIPDAPPAQLYGAVFTSDQAIDMFQFEEDSYGTELINIGIKFTGASTGHGVSADQGQSKRTVCFGRVENVTVLGNNSSHYAFNFKNIQHTYLSRLSGFGGPTLKIVNDDTTPINYGNLIAQMIYGYIGPNPVANGCHPFHLESVNGFFNLSGFYRLQANYYPSSASPADHWGLYLKGIRDMHFGRLA
jgi:hypothetical protein